MRIRAGPARVAWSSRMNSSLQPVRPCFLYGFILRARLVSCSSRAWIISGVTRPSISRRRRARSLNRASTLADCPSSGMIFSASFVRRRAESGRITPPKTECAAAPDWLVMAFRQKASASCGDAGSPRMRGAGSRCPLSRSAFRRRAASARYSYTGPFQP